LPYFVQGAALAPTTTGLLSSGQFRRLAIALIAIALAFTIIAVEAPQATDAHAVVRTDAQRIVAIAKSHLGARFRIGTTGMRYFDCSGLVYRVYQQAGLLRKIGGTRMRAASYYHWFRQRGLVSRSNPQVGDVIWWTHKGRIVHMGLWIGGGRALSALTTGVKIHHLYGISVKFFAFGHVHLSR
jgi:cell wall-associated NlpC family hydrolase